MEKFKHKYIFYFFPKWDRKTEKRLKGFFLFFGRVSDGKKFALISEREFDYQKIF